MEDLTIKYGNNDGEAWELVLVAEKEETLYKAKLCLERMEKSEEGIVVDPTDVRTLFYENNPVLVEYIEVSDGTQLKEAVAEVVGKIQECGTEDLVSVLMYIEGDVGFLEATEATEQVQAILEDDANIVFGISEPDGQVGIKALLALA